jgi:ADP-ribose pyrophosphatase YjhB (NUDIX family)
MWSHFLGFWACVGGFIKSNETPQEALRREFKEETNLDVEIGIISLIDLKKHQTE